MADGNPDDHQQDSTAGDLPVAENGGDDKCYNVDNTIPASSSNSSVAEGLSSLISSVMTTFESRAEDTTRSQDQLASALDRLTGELDKLLEDAPSPFIMQHAARISGVRKRVKALNTVLKSIQCRIDNMDHLMSAGVVHVVERGIGSREKVEWLFSYNGELKVIRVNARASAETLVGESSGQKHAL